jgi:hypothetical protein
MAFYGPEGQEIDPHTPIGKISNPRELIASILWTTSPNNPFDFGHLNQDLTIQPHPTQPDYKEPIFTANGDRIVDYSNSRPQLRLVKNDPPITEPDSELSLQDHILGTYPLIEDPKHYLETRQLRMDQRKRRNQRILIERFLGVGAAMIAVVGLIALANKPALSQQNAYEKCQDPKIPHSKKIATETTPMHTSYNEYGAVMGYVNKGNLVDTIEVYLPGGGPTTGICGSNAESTGFVHNSSLLQQHTLREIATGTEATEKSSTLTTSSNLK